MPKYIFVTGGVVSSLGKGLAASSIGALLEARGVHVTLIKLDPYLNIDPGTMSPFQHGEVFVTDDGAETDLDLGHYERFTGISVTRSHNVTAGQIYDSILSKERRGEYLGQTVQVIPHVTDEPTIYEVPLVFHRGGLDALVANRLGLDSGESDLAAWSGFVERVRAPKRRCTVAIVGKYTHVRDAYKSLIESLVHAGAAHD